MPEPAAEDADGWLDADLGARRRDFGNGGLQFVDRVGRDGLGDRDACRLHGDGEAVLVVAEIDGLGICRTRRKTNAPDRELVANGDQRLAVAHSHHAPDSFRRGGVKCPFSIVEVLSRRRRWLNEIFIGGHEDVLAI
ncbi:hypothetical protein D3C87_1661500 [compost metagenome]